jgi:serine/threonine protein kinase
MSELDWGAVRKIFEAALDLPAAQRPQFILERCGHNAALRQEVEQMLNAEAAAGAFLEQPALAQEPTSAIPLPDFVGRRVGPYQIQSKLGAGGMGAVYLAERVDNVFKKKVAVKILQPGTGQRELQRFFQERQILAELEHPNIARLLDGGSLDGLPYVIMEYVPGASLRTLLAAQGTLPLEQIVEITKQICAGLHFAHSKGIIHRDIKPDNIMVQETAGFLQVKILDFGIAKLTDAQEVAYKTSTGLIFGTPKYMSPEQIQATASHQLDARSDVYSLGMVIYEMLTGQVAFAEPTWMQIAYHHVHTKPTRPSVRRPDLPIPPALERVVLRALEKDRAQRPPTALALAQELQAALPSAPAPASVPANILNTQETVAYDATTVARQAPISPITVTATQPQRPAPRPKKLHLVATTFLLVAAGTAGLIYSQFKPAAISDLQNNVHLPAPTTPPQAVRYQIFVEKGQALTPIAAHQELHSEEKIRFQLLPPFAGLAYLFLEEASTRNLYWINSITRPPDRVEVQQIGGTEKTWLPAEQFIPLGAVRRREKIRFLLVCVPTGVEWPFENLVNSDLKNYGNKEGYLSAVPIPTAGKNRILESLQQGGVNAPLAFLQDSNAPIASIPMPDQKQVLYQWIELEQAP